MSQMLDLRQLSGFVCAKRDNNQLSKQIHAYQNATSQQIPGFTFWSRKRLSRFGRLAGLELEKFRTIARAFTNWSQDLQIEKKIDVTRLHWRDALWSLHSLN